MKTTNDSTNAAETANTTEDFYESVLRERSPLTGEIAPPRYSLLPKAIPVETALKNDNEAFTSPRRKSWTWLAAAVLLAVLIVFLALCNTTNAVNDSQQDTTEAAASKK